MYFWKRWLKRFKSRFKGWFKSRLKREPVGTGKLCSYCRKEPSSYQGMMAAENPTDLNRPIPPDRARACRKCYRIQWARKYPGEPLPV